MTRRPHSFQAAADELASSSGGPAGSSVPGRSEGPATFPRYLVTTDAEYGWWKVEDQLNGQRVFRSTSRAECHKVADTKSAEHGARVSPRRKPAIDGYDALDIEDALRGIEAALPFALAAFRCHLENNEHVMSFVDWDGFADRLSDLVADDLRGPLMRRMDEMRG